MKRYDWINRNILQVNRLYCELDNFVNNKSCYSKYYNTARKHYDCINTGRKKTSDLYCEILKL